ncbi:hypothetical protein [Streptomyces netropsis]|uniref:Secreted protein n=1 Tax=Streptomyces netropsis TaxID=55404 RepID=A0A7W7LEQ8_STRNE|nr:hypothetical protein [Streptomyces netropsis]MBB4888331.1 hypothetical protein [Streptomyces netropsis]GGR30030.1 hypothetical protein GCM10010219_38670 [Streptomyces netropsis]
MIGGRRAAVALSSLALVGSSWAGAPAGQADEGRHRGPGGVVCTGPSTSVYAPPLTLESRATRVHTEARYTCTVAPGRTVPATGSLDGVSPSASCNGLTSPRITEIVRYADGERSLIVYDSGTTLRTVGVLDVHLSGRVTEGRGKGQSAQRDVLLALPRELPTECLSSGLQGNSGQAQLEIRP